MRRLPISMTPSGSSRNVANHPSDLRVHDRANTRPATTTTQIPVKRWDDPNPARTPMILLSSKAADSARENFFLLFTFYFSLFTFHFSLLTFFPLAVDLPRYAEAIDEHAKTRGPERFLQRHDNCPVFPQLVKDTRRVDRALDLNRQREAFGLLI